MPTRTNAEKRRGLLRIFLESREGYYRSTVALNSRPLLVSQSVQPRPVLLVPRFVRMRRRSESAAGDGVA